MASKKRTRRAKRMRACKTQHNWLKSNCVGPGLCGLDATLWRVNPWGI